MRILLTTVAGLLLATATAFSADFDLRFQSFWEGGTVNQQAFIEFAEEVGKESGGRINIEALPAGAIVPPTEMLEATANGILHGMHAGGALHIGKDPAFALLNDVPAGYETPKQFIDWYYNGGGLQLAQELYAQHGVHFVGPVLWGAESIPTKKKIAHIEDFQGVKMRAPEGISAQVWRAIGVGVSTLPGSEVYTALDTGKIDATDWGTLGMNDQLGFDRIAEYAIYPGIHSMPAGDVAINQKTWDSLPDDLKAQIEKSVRHLNDRMLEANQKLDEEAVAKRDSSTLLAWSSEDRAKLRDVAKGKWEEWSKKSPMAEKIYKSHVEYMKSIGLLSN